MGAKITIEIDYVEKEKKEGLEPNGGQERLSDYARCFDESCASWHKDAEWNLMFLRQQEVYANDLLKVRGFIFLNEIYEMLGLPRSKAGQIVGWVYNLDNPTGDNYIDFGLYTKRNKDFVNGYERIAWLDFNVDGIIIDKVLS